MTSKSDVLYGLRLKWLEEIFFMLIFLLRKKFLRIHGTASNNAPKNKFIVAFGSFLSFYVVKEG